MGNIYANLVSPATKKACRRFELDLQGTGFNQCTCGFPRGAHAERALRYANAHAPIARSPSPAGAPKRLAKRSSVLHVAECDEFRIDLSANEFGKCICGFPKKQHHQAALEARSKRKTRVSQLHAELDLDALYIKRMLVMSKAPPLDKSAGRSHTSSSESVISSSSQSASKERTTGAPLFPLFSPLRLLPVMSSAEPVKEPPKLKQGTVKALAASLGVSFRPASCLPVESWPDNERPTLTYNHETAIDPGREGGYANHVMAPAASASMARMLQASLSKPRKPGRPRS